ncbi:MAG: 6-phosphogluconolactonase [Spirochaetales bacterium]|nr:6-phosphogluconolactonase [Spirochaetales bacterium]
MSGGPIPVNRVSAGEAAWRIFSSIESVLKRKGSCAVILAGGESPRPVYLALGALLTGRVDPGSLYFFLGDERVAECGSPERNETMIRESLFREFKPPEENLHFWDALPVTPGESAAHYSKKIDEYFLRPALAPDIALLGLGADGHTASLFPGAEVVVAGRRRPVAADLPQGAFAVFVPSNNLWRLSLSAAFLRTSGETVFLVGGEGKEKAIAGLSRRDRSLPASWAAGEGDGVAIFLVISD